MKVVNSESLSRLEHIPKKELFSRIVRLIFSVSEVSKSFSDFKLITERHKNILEAKKKTSQQNRQLDKIIQLKESLAKQNAILKHENSERKKMLLSKMRVAE